MRTVNIVFKSLYACAHQCGFCHVLHVPRNNSFMSTDEVKATFDQIETLFAGSRVEMEMSGGEFTMRKDAVELIEYLRTKQIRWSSLVLDTMGVLLADEDLARALGALFDKVNVSVHACDADLHAATSGARTPFAHLEAGLRNIFRFFPAVFTNTSISALNHNRLIDIAHFILAAREASPATPLHCLYYLPVYREYGESNKENRFRLQGSDNGEFVPPASAMRHLKEEFVRARTLLAGHGVAALLRDFNLPACIYHAVSGSFPEHAFGLPNFMSDCYFTDFAHPIAERHTLEAIYPSMHQRVKPPRCEACLVEDVCPGIPSAWLGAGHQPEPIDAEQYSALLPLQLLNQTLFSIVHDAVRMKRLLSLVSVDWAALAGSFFGALVGDSRTDIRQARARVASLPAAQRAAALVQHLQSRGDREWCVLASLLDQELSRASESVCRA
jgi:MoaA/NifB/PqqE/SkfB family radical SAM enzyme